EYLLVASPTVQMVVPAVGLPSESAHLNAAPPHSCTSIPRWSLYQALSATVSVELKKIPPIPVTLFISVSYTWVRVKGRIFRGLTPEFSCERIKQKRVHSTRNPWLVRQLQRSLCRCRDQLEPLLAANDRRTLSSREGPELGRNVPFQVRIRARRGMTRFYSRTIAERLRSLPAVILREPPSPARP